MCVKYPHDISPSKSFKERIVEVRLKHKYKITHQSSQSSESFVEIGETGTEKNKKKVFKSKSKKKVEPFETNTNNNADESSSSVDYSDQIHNLLSSSVYLRNHILILANYPPPECCTQESFFSHVKQACGNLNLIYFLCLLMGKDYLERKSGSLAARFTNCDVEQLLELINVDDIVAAPRSSNELHVQYMKRLLLLVRLQIIAMIGSLNGRVTGERKVLTVYANLKGAPRALVSLMNKANIGVSDSVLREYIKVSEEFGKQLMKDKIIKHVREGKAIIWCFDNYVHTFGQSVLSKTGSYKKFDTTTFGGHFLDCLDPTIVRRRTRSTASATRASPEELSNLAMNYVKTIDPLKFLFLGGKDSKKYHLDHYVLGKSNHYL
jgi:hypothetical protein